MSGKAWHSAAAVRGRSGDLLTQAQEWTSLGDAELDEWRQPVDHWTIEMTREAAAIAAGRVRFGIDRWQVRDLAWEGVAAAIAASPHASWQAAVDAGATAARSEISQTLAAHGARRDGQSTGRGHAVYWLDWAAPIGTPDSVLDRIAVRQVVDALDPDHRDALLLWAATFDFDAIADAYGCSRSHAIVLLRRARTAAYRLWFDQDQPPPLGSIRKRTAGDTCPQGHPYDGWARNNRTGRRMRTCRTCKRERAA